MNKKILNINDQMENPSLQMRGITKRFPGVIANDNVDLTLYPGEIHALLGENGAGKSTLMNILAGIYRQNEGEILLNGSPADISSPKAAVELGIGMVHQHFKLIDVLTVAENILLCSSECDFILNKKNMNKRIKEVSAQYGLEVDPSAKIWQLSVGEQQRVEIVKQLFFGADLLILDEPTSVLTPQETENLFKTLRMMTKEGKTVLFITHKLFEVVSFADRITVLRNGKLIDTLAMSEEVDRELLAEMMVGRQMKKISISNGNGRSKPKECGLKLENITVLGDRGVPALNELSLEIRCGEILGIAGVAGNGQKELCEVIAGLRPPTKGTIILHGEDISDLSCRQTAEKGVGYIPEDRMGTGLVGNLNMMDNSILRDFNSCDCNKRGFLNRDSIQKRTNGFVTNYDIKHAGLTKPVGFMSGGNLQKLLVAREIDGNPKLIIAAYPVHGVDVGASETIHELLLEERKRGAAILLISEDLEELFSLSDRVAGLYSGQITGYMDIGEVTDETFKEAGRLMLGIKKSENKSHSVSSVAAAL